MTLDEFLKRYRNDRPTLVAWGKYVKDRIDGELRQQLQNEKYDDVIKIEPKSRTKDEQSLINKVFVRKAGKYKEPYEEVTDKVGVRFVVLLTSQLNRLKNIVESIPDWAASLDRDFQEERERDPVIFDYQSIHFVVCAVRDMEIDGITVREGTPCEVQLRTLLQHAYAEVAHDTIYKSKTKAKPEVIRTLAKSMALMETTDELLVKAREVLGELGKFISTWESTLIQEYDKEFRDKFEYKYDEKTTIMVIDECQELLTQHNTSDLNQYLQKNNFIINQILDNVRSDVLFRQPLILLIYFLVYKHRNKFAQLWPFEKGLVYPVYAGLGLTHPKIH